MNSINFEVAGYCLLFFVVFFCLFLAFRSAKFNHSKFPLNFQQEFTTLLNVAICQGAKKRKNEKEEERTEDEYYYYAIIDIYCNKCNPTVYLSRIIP